MNKRWTLAAILLCLLQPAPADERPMMQRERAVLRQPADLRMAAEREAPRPPVDGCVQTAYQYKPSPLDSLDMEVLEQADATLVVALGLLDVSVDAGERAVDRELLHKSQILARYLLAICATGGCPGDAFGEPGGATSEPGSASDE